MRPSSRVRAAFVLALYALLTGCGERREAVQDKSTAKPANLEAPRDQIPAERLGAVIAANDRGLGLMEQYEYSAAITAFRQVRELAPGWIPGSINLAIAILNFRGSQAAKSEEEFGEALGLLNQVLKREPANLHAHFCRGLILNSLQDPGHPERLALAHADFRLVTERDPGDGHAWLKFGDTLLDPTSVGEPGGPRAAGPKQASEIIAVYTKALECNPYLVPALYKLMMAYGWKGERDRAKTVQDLWSRLNPERNAAAPGEIAKDFYGDSGKYSRVIDTRPAHEMKSSPVPPPRFAPPMPLVVALPPGDRWVEEKDFAGPYALLGRARNRFGSAVATFDADGDGRQDLYLAAAVVGPGGLRDTLLLNRGGGNFEDATRAANLPTRPSLGVAAGDFDADGAVDLYLTGVGDNRLLRNRGTGRFEDATQALGPVPTPAVSPTARWLDLDQDGDLDLYVVNFTAAANTDAAFTEAIPAGLVNEAYRNDGKPAPVAGTPAEASWVPRVSRTEDLKASKGLSVAFSPWKDARDLLGGVAPHTAIAALDLDDDRDIDLVLAAEARPSTAILNDRLGRFRSSSIDLFKGGATSTLLVTDLDRDGRGDVVALDPRGPVLAARNSAASHEEPRDLPFTHWPSDARSWRSALVADLDLDGGLDLLGLPAPGDFAPQWSRNEGSRLVTHALALGPEPGEPRPLRGLAFANIAGDPLPDLILIREGQGPRVARNLGNGRHWLAFNLTGRWRTSPWNPMRSNPQALGTRLALEGEGLDVRYVHTTPEAGSVQSVAPIVLGLGTRESAPLVRVRWPDGVNQCELNEPADKLRELAELNRRKESSCPVLFTWNGERFVCVADFLGGGGLGYLIAPGQYGEPDRDEAVAIEADQLRPVDGVLRLAVTEPMSEVSYLDRLALDVVDQPPGVTVGLDERFAPGGQRPSGNLIAWRTTIGPSKVTDLGGRNLTGVLRTRDRKTANGFRRLSSWIGYAEEHGIVLDFGDRLARFGAKDRLVLGLDGWVEYPYSQTNYAASTAGVALKPPVLERLGEDGHWRVLEADLGYPAGLPRLMTLELTGKLAGPRCVIRLRTNMECYWDRAFIAPLDPAPGVRVTGLPVARASLGYRGYTRENSPDGQPPFLYEYDHVEPAPLAGLAGRLTRYGDVAELLREDDDRLCLLGPGDEVRLEFDAGNIPPTPQGWTRSYVLRAVGYCKDADPFTGGSDSVGPLPWRGMPAYPFGPEGRRPEDQKYRAYLDAYQVRPATP